MSSILPDSNEEQLFQKIAKYSLKDIQYIQGKEKIPRIAPKLTKSQKNPNLYFINISPQSLQFRRIARVTVAQLISQQDLTYQQILKNSTIEDIIELDEINKFQKKAAATSQGLHYIIGIYDNRKESVDKTKISIGFRMTSEENMNLFYEEANRKLKDQKDYLKKSGTNFVGIQEGIRRIVDRILVASFAKREVYNRILEKICERNIKLSSAENKIVVYALIGNHPDMQNFIRKEKIQAYEIQKKRYEEFLKEESLTNMTELVEPGREHIIEGYSQKRKLDGLIIKKQKQSKEVDNLRNQQQLFLAKIPSRPEWQIDELIGLNEKVEQIDIEQKPIKDLPMSYRAQKIKIPVKDYGIMNKQIDKIQKQPIGQGEAFDKNSQVTIEIIKFMYQLIRANSRHRILNSIVQGPIDKVLECLRDVLMECEKRQEDRIDRKTENRHINEMLEKAKKNYMSYRRNPNKFC